VTSVFKPLFQIYFSGTQAPVEQRVRVVEGLLRSDDPVRRDLGVLGLSALLKAWQFHSSHGFAFGARPRDFGYWPSKRQDIEHWYACVLRMLEPLAVSDEPIAERVRHTLAARFRELWRAGAYDGLERVSHAIVAKHDWQEGWIAIRKTQRHDAKQMSAKSRMRLAVLESALRPGALVQQVRAVVLTEAWGPLDFADIEPEADGANIMASHDRAQATAEALGSDVAKDTTGVFAQLLPDLVRGRGARLGSFGVGLARAAADRRAVWRELVGAVAAAPEQHRNVGILRGYLGGLAKADPALCDTLLEEVVTDATLARWFPDLQTSVPLDGRAVARLKRSLAAGKAPIGDFAYLSGGRATDPLSGAELAGLLRAFAGTPEGVRTAVQILSMRISCDKDAKQGTAPELITAGRELLAAMPYGKSDDMQDHYLQTIVGTCLRGEDGGAVAGRVIERFMASVASRDAYAHPYDHFLQALFKVQPKAALDAFFGGDEQSRNLSVRTIEEMCESRENPLDQAADDVVLAWCAEDASVRYPLIASAVSFARSGESAPLQWSPVAVRLLDEAPDSAAVLDRFVDRFDQDRDGGRKSVILESRLRLLDELKLTANSALADFVQRKREQVGEEIEGHRKWETQIDKSHDEKFEWEG
jgi:hypothetical protein